MTTHLPTSPASLARADEGLGWILDEFVGRVTGVTSALLVSRDGLRMAVSRVAGTDSDTGTGTGTGTGTDQADKTAAWISSLHSLARADGVLSKSDPGGFRQAVIERDTVVVFVMSADHTLDQAEARRHGPGSRLVGSVLGVLAQPDADPGVVAHEMGLLVRSVAKHLTTATRGGEHTDGGH